MACLQLYSNWALRVAVARSVVFKEYGLLQKEWFGGTIL
jgi:hypothetical protein